MTEHDAFRFWGKSRGGVHPALCHMVDAGMVARAMVERAPAVATRGLLPDDPGLLGAWVALHDIGKISPGFQAKEPALADRLAPELRRTAADCTDHALVGCDVLGGVGSLWARALGAHHGQFPQAQGYVEAGRGAWVTARDEAHQVLSAVFGLSTADVGPAGELAPAQAVVLAGLTAICDWIGSDATLFRRLGEQTERLGLYATPAYEQAGAALDTLGWDGWLPDARRRSFEQLFGFEPNALQQRAAELAERLTGPSLMVIEAPMGGGKTEAALYLADRLLAANGHVGVYYALPTQATSGAMFRRFLDYVERRFPGQSPTVLLRHAMAAFDETFEALCRKQPPAACPEGIEDKEKGGAVAAASWFRGAKQGLLTPLAVGTIDQALFGVLQTRHQFVRLYGLANKVVVLDEVHAYDAYTTGLIERLLEWLRVLGCSVVLLSATLPKSRRETLLKAWGGGPVADWGRYPRLTAVCGAGVEVLTVAAEPRPMRVEPLTLSGEWHQTVIDHLAEQLADGGCAAWLCNTVGRAQEACLRLKADGRFDQVDLFHARFPLGRRAQIEQQVLARYGKDGTQRPERAVLVATQVIEQSLDLDFDLMVSDPAPVDLLLQRAGRVHRHRGRVRPTRLAEGILWYLEPSSLKQTFSHLAACAKVYNDWLLLRTLLALDGGVTVAGPADIEALVERVYGAEEMAAPPELAAAAERARCASDGQAAEQRRLAMTHGLCAPDAEDPFSVCEVLPDEEIVDPALAPSVQRALTRLGEPSLMLVCTEGDIGGLDERQLVARAVRVQHAGWVRHFAHEAVPEWQASPVLRHWRLARLSGGRLLEAPGEMRLTEELGLVLSRDVLALLG